MVWNIIIIIIILIFTIKETAHLANNSQNIYLNNVSNVFVQILKISLGPKHWPLYGQKKPETPFRNIF